MVLRIGGQIERQQQVSWSRSEQTMWDAGLDAKFQALIRTVNYTGCNALNLRILQQPAHLSHKVLRLAGGS